MVARTVDATVDESAVVGGIGGSTKTAIELGRRYEAAGVDGVMIMAPSHTYLHERGVLKYHRRIVKALDTPVVLYKRGPRSLKTSSRNSRLRKMSSR